MWPTIEPFLLEKSNRRKMGGKIRESTWMSNREGGNCAGRYDGNKVWTTRLNNYGVCSAETEGGPEHIYYKIVVREQIRRLIKHLSMPYAVQKAEEGVYVIAVKKQIRRLNMHLLWRT